MFEIPQRILDKYKVAKSSVNKIEMARDYDLEVVTSALNDNLIRVGRVYSVEQAYPIMARFGKCDYEIAKILEIEFRKFVALTLVEPDSPHAPSGAVDMYWHFFILHTELYSEFSNLIWGGFRGSGNYRHHYPATDDTRSGMLRAYSNTLVLYRDVFGEPVTYQRSVADQVRIWTDRSATSGDSYSGIVDSCDPLTPEEIADWSDE